MARTLQAPRTENLPSALAHAARRLGERLDAAGFQHWLVGGCVRDLALGIEPHDVDLATDATPDRVEELFDRTVAVGKAFGTVVVHDAGCEVQITTFRTDGAYSDGRRPDEVAYGTTPEQDAQRRDFTCNALYLDPLTDALHDPTGGWADLERGRLRCVGTARERFSEDGLRLLRLARFAAAYELSPDDETIAAARAEAERVGSVSRERILAELTRMADGPAPARAVELLDETGVLTAVFPEADLDLAAARALPPQAGLVVLLATLLGGAGAAEALESLRLARTDLDGVRATWAAIEALERFADEPAPERPRARALLLLRDPGWEAARQVLAARGPRPAVRRRLDEIDALAKGSSPAELHPPPLLESADLEAAGVPRGPAWGTLLRAAEERQLEGELSDRDAALAWLATQAANPAAAPEADEESEPR